MIQKKKNIVKGTFIKDSVKIFYYAFVGEKESFYKDKTENILDCKLYVEEQNILTL